MVRLVLPAASRPFREVEDDRFGGPLELVDEVCVPPPDVPYCLFDVAYHVNRGVHDLESGS